MVKVGVIGVGHLGRQHARLYAEIAELAGVVDIIEERAKEIAAQYHATPYTDYRDIFGKVDAVSLAVPTTDHARLGIDLLNHGIDVLVEKPIAASLEQAHGLIIAADVNNRILQAGHVERFNPVVMLAREVATRPQFFEIHRLAAFTPRSLDIDVVLDLMIHDIDIVCSLVKAPVREVRAVGIPVLSHKADIANARVEFEDGCVANFTASRVSFEKTRKLRFFQPHDYISVDYAAQKGTMVSLRNGRVTERKLEPENQEPLKVELLHFLRCVETRETPVVTGEDGHRALDLAMRINAAIAERLVLR
ncbi:MAG: Gfo/Idh/MocA family oxidoreductase [Acidobacteria bacterium]|nr:Gfo/Idh/MocA family oxidoreductase [Acidobacteriota bacterium]